MEKDEQFVQDVVKAIVDTPDKVTTNRTVDEMGVLIELTVDPADMGKIIGKEGKTAKSIRTLLRVLGAKNNARVNLKIVEPEGSEHVRKEDRADETAEKADDTEEKVEKVDDPEEKVEEKKEDILDVPGDVLDEE